VLTLKASTIFSEAAVHPESQHYSEMIFVLAACKAGYHSVLAVLANSSLNHPDTRTISARR